MGQIKSTINVREVMDTGKIMLVDLSVGKIGEDNAALLGSMIITKIQLAAMGRADTPEDERRDFYLYVDEFQNFATESFAVILSEARKYHLNLIITHQYIAQMPEVVASAVFGNVGTIIAFRVGASDASFLQKEFEPVFDSNDLVNLDNYTIYLKMAIDARTAPPFSAKTLPPFSGKNDNRAKSISESIRKYTVDRAAIEAEIEARNEANSGKIGTLVEVAGEVVYKEELKPYEPMAPLPKNETVGGVERWKIRDKEGKPYYVAGEDYDAFMEAKGKPSDRPGAVASGTSDSSQQETSLTEDAVLAVASPIVDELDELKAATAPETTPKADKPEPKSEKTETKKHLSKEPEKRGDTPHDQGGKGTGSHSAHPHPHPRQHQSQADKPVEHKSETKGEQPAPPPSAKHDIVRHKIEEKYNQSEQTIVTPMVEQSVQNTSGQRSVEKSENKNVTDVMVIEPVASAPKPADVQLNPSQPAQSTQQNVTVQAVQIEQNTSVPVVTTQPVVPQLPASHPVAAMSPAAPILRPSESPMQPVQTQPISQHIPQQQVTRPMSQPSQPSEPAETTVAHTFNDFTNGESDDSDVIPLQEL
jgi:hypothetical protein